MNEYPLNDIIYDSKIWKKDSLDEKDESSNNNIQNSKKKNNKSSKNGSMSSNSNNTNSNNTNSNCNNSNNTNSNNSDNNSISLGVNNIINNKQKINKNNGNGKKLTLPIGSISKSLKLKKETNKTSNNIGKKIQKPLESKKVSQNLPSIIGKSKEQNTNCFDKIKDKNLNEKKNNSKTKTQENKITKKNNIISKDLNYQEKNKKTNKIQSKNNDVKIIKKIGGSEENEEFEDEKDDEVLKINKVATIDIKSNFMNDHYLLPNNPFYNNTLNNYNSNNSKKPGNQICVTESDDSYNKSSSVFDPPSGRSNNSIKTFFTTNSCKGNQMDRYPHSNKYPLANVINNNENNIRNYNSNNIFYPQKNTALMGSFLSTGANSHSHSGQRYDTSNSNESGQSPHNYNVLQRQFSNSNFNNFTKSVSGTMNNNINKGAINNNMNNNMNYNYMMQINPLERHIYPSNCNSNELVFKQPFSINSSFFYKNNKGNLFSINSEPKEKQIIKLEDIARGIEKRTTVMIRNVPIKYTVEVLEKELEYFVGKYDCIYVPFDYENGGNKGYAFINLIHPYHVLLFYEVFQGKCWTFFESKKICELNYANFQGINEIMKHAKNYKGIKKPTFYINTKTKNTSIEVPKKYLYILLQTHPNLKYYENNLFNTIVLESL